MTNKIECNCSLSTRLCGDGCKKCQPDTYIFNLEGALQSAEQEIEQLRSEIESLKKAPTESQILFAAEKAGLWPNTIYTWINQFHRYHAELLKLQSELKGYNK